MLHAIYILCMLTTPRQSDSNLGTDNFDSSVVAVASVYNMQIGAGSMPSEDLTDRKGSEVCTEQLGGAEVAAS